MVISPLVDTHCCSRVSIQFKDTFHCVFIKVADWCAVAKNCRQIHHICHLVPGREINTVYFVLFLQRFLQFLASRNTLFNLSNFLDKTGSHGGWCRFPSYLWPDRPSLMLNPDASLLSWSFWCQFFHPFIVSSTLPLILTLNGCFQRFTVEQQYSEHQYYNQPDQFQLSQARFPQLNPSPWKWIQSPMVINTRFTVCCHGHFVC